jgi:hypothetical protein
MWLTKLGDNNRLLFKTMWIELENLLQTPDFVSLAENHLQASNYTVKGYYDLHDNYYKSIEIPQCTLMFRGVKISYKNIYHRLLQYSLYVDTTIIGELTLVYDKQGNFIDENWELDIYYQQKFKSLLEVEKEKNE